MNAVVRERGRAELSTAQVRSFIGNGARLLVERSLRAAGLEPSDGEIASGLEAFKRHYLDHCLDSTVLYPGIESVLRRLHGTGVRLAVLTNKPRGFTERILEGLDIRSVFSGVVGGDDLPTRKPHPEGLEKLVSAAGCARAAARMVGDSPVDLDTAAAAEVPACAVGWGFSSEADLRAAGATTIARDARSLFESLASSRGRSG